mgnify:CR=1 FL=1
MYDIERLNAVIRDIEKYFAELKKINLTKENLHIPEKFYSSSMLMFGILNRTIDLAGDIIIKNDFGMPSSYEQYFEVLEKNSIIDKSMEKGLKQLAKDRNLFAHQYFSMNEREVLNVSKRISTAKDFVEKIKKVVQRAEKR